MSQPDGSGAGIPEMPPPAYTWAGGVVKSTVSGLSPKDCTRSNLRSRESVARTWLAAAARVSCAIRTGDDEVVSVLRILFLTSLCRAGKTTLVPLRGSSVIGRHRRNSSGTFLFPFHHHHTPADNHRGPRRATTAAGPRPGRRWRHQSPVESTRPGRLRGTTAGG